MLTGDEEIQRAVARLVARRLEQLHTSLITAGLELVHLPGSDQLVIRDIRSERVLEIVERLQS
tara:strand:- start:339 stop:527 length:189 start_codon:yes stop_codon:yes gene_type:complete